MAIEYNDSNTELNEVLSSDFDWSHPAEILKVLGHPVRLKIVALLCQGDMHVSGLMERLGVRQATISQHLRLLRMNGVVEGTRVNGYKMYRLIQPKIPVLLRCIVGCKEPSNKNH